MRSAGQAGITLRLMLFTTGLLILALAAASLSALQSFRSHLEPELSRKALVIAETIGEQVGRAGLHGIPLDKLNGMSSFVTKVVEKHSEVRRVDLRDAVGQTLFTQTFGDQRNDELFVPSSFAVTIAGEKVAEVSVYVDPTFADRAIAEVTYDIGITFLVALFIAFEILLVFATLRILLPMAGLRQVLSEGAESRFERLLPSRGHDEIGRFVRTLNEIVVLLNQQRGELPTQVAAAGDKLARQAATVEAEEAVAEAKPEKKGKLDYLRLGSPVDIRLPLFLSFFANELSRPFLPLYARDLYVPIPFLDQDTAIALPITAYMLLVAILSPFTGSWTQKIGARRAYLLGLMPMILGLIMSARAETLIDLVIWRCVNAAGFAVTSLAALNYIADVTTSETRARGMVTFTVAFVTAGVCGSSVGGILADRIGYGPTFYVGAALAILAAMLIWAILPKHAAKMNAAAQAADAASKDKGKKKGGGGAFKRVLKTPAFTALILLIGIPMQMMIWGYLFFTGPLMLNAMDYPTAVIGRVLMAYYIVMVFGSQAIARAADRFQRHDVFAAGGLSLAGLAAILLLPGLAYADGYEAWVVGGAFALTGIGHAMCVPSQGALLLSVAERGGKDYGATIGLYRLLERAGCVIGPFLAGSLMSRIGHAETIAVIGVICLTTGILFGLLHQFSSRQTRSLETGSP